jgi:hypothetical protein
LIWAVEERVELEPVLEEDQVAVLVALDCHPARPDDTRRLKLLLLVRLQQFLRRLLASGCDHTTHQLVLVQALTQFVEQLQETQHAGLGIALVQYEDVVLVRLRGQEITFSVM